MNILFLGRHYTYFRNFESVLRELAGRGHTIHAAVERSETFGGRQLIEELSAQYPGITHGEAPARAAEGEWGWVAGWLRLGLDFLRYQHPLFDDAPKLRERAGERTPEAFVAASRLPLFGTRLRTPLVRLLRRLERAVPAEPAVRTYLEAHRPDLVLLTPLIDLGSSQIDYLRAARAMGIPTALCVWSWDHLSSKALIREWPDRVLLWNETQKREAIDLHGVPASRVVVTGAQCFDQWFDRQPSRSREAFCHQVGLPANRPFLLYTCSALFGGSPSEAEFVIEWIKRLRRSAAARVASAGILVRPHPSRLADWEQRDISALGNVVLWGSNPVDAQARADYFDSLYHSAAVVGLNTSAFIEAGVVGRPVHTILLPEFYENQMGTLHFRYLRAVGGGLLNVAETYDEHVAQLVAALDRPAGAVTPFVKEFVRPLGLTTRATTVFVDAVEAMQGIVPEPAAVDRWTPYWQRLLARLGRARHRPAVQRWVMSEREYASVKRLRTVIAEKEEHRLGLVRERDAKKAAAASVREAQAAAEAARQAAAAAARTRRLAEREAARVAEAAARQRLAAEQQAAKQARVEARVQAKQRHVAAKRAARLRQGRREAIKRRLGAMYRTVFGPGAETNGR